MKRKILIVALICVLCSITGCDSKNNDGKQDSISEMETEKPIDKVLSIEDMIENEKVYDYFYNKSVAVSDMELEKRQTNKEEKEDIAYVKITSINNSIKMIGTYEIKSIFYDVGGWQIENITVAEQEIYEPIYTPTLDTSDKNGYVDVMDEGYEGDNAYYIKYSCSQSGEIAEIKNVYKEHFLFNIYTGEWSEGTVDVVEHKIKLSEKTSGKYKFQRDLNYEKSDYYILEYDEKNNSMHLKVRDYSSDWPSDEYELTDWGKCEIKYSEEKDKYYLEYIIKNTYEHKILIVLDVDEIYKANEYLSPEIGRNLIKYDELSEKSPLSIIINYGTDSAREVINYEHIKSASWVISGSTGKVCVRIKLNEDGHEKLEKAFNESKDSVMRVVMEGKGTEYYLDCNSNVDMKGIINGEAYIWVKSENEAYSVLEKIVECISS